MESEEDQKIVEKPAQRLCSEIQLFDLCDLEVCIYKEGRFCRKEELLSRFEHIADEDVCQPVRRLSHVSMEDEDADEMGFGEATIDENDEYEEREDDWEE